MNNRIRIVLVLLLLLPGALVQAITVEAEGRALIVNQDLDSARRQALANASQQAIMQAGAHISSTQTINQGVLSVDNLRIRSQGNLTDVRVLDERVQGQLFIIRIRALVNQQQSCQQAGSGANYLKAAAVAAFVIEHPLEANLGDLHDAAQTVSKLVADDLTAIGNLRAINAGQMKVNPVTTTAAGLQQDNGAITDALPEFKDLDVQFIISGVIRDLRMYDPTRNSEGNVFKYYYDSLDPRGRQHMRNFAVDVFIHDGFTGALLFSRRFREGGLWTLDDHVKTGFASAAFLATDYGQRIHQLIRQITDELDQQLRCEPFRARIISTERNSITFNAGALVGIRPGDKLTVYRQSSFYDQQQQPHIRLENTRHTLIVGEVYPRFSVGKIDIDSEQKNIQQDDVLLAW